MKISARNAFPGKVVSVRTGALNAEVDFSTAGGDHLVAIVSNESVQNLGLAAGVAATALVKASSVMILTDGSGFKLSARNCLAGTVATVTPGPVSADVAVRLKGGDVVHATITSDAVKELGIAAGGAVAAVFKASSVILAVAV
ncbi:MAG: TOBE domain-containing protein [Pseudomonadota bacterium]|nr:TOBE domain-containing protein [Pseudomonadota bacterium]